MRKVVIFGAGQIAEVVHYYLQNESDREVAGFSVDASHLQGDTLMGLPVVPFETVEATFPPSAYDMYVAVSFRGLNKLRRAKVAEAEAKGYRLIGYVSPRAAVWKGFVLRPNTFIMENNVIQPYAEVGQNVILWSGNHLGHHSRIDDHCFIASHVVISGSVRVGEASFVGVNAAIRDNVTIGARNVIGAGALILADTPDDAVYMGEASQKSPVPSNRLRGI